MRLFLLFIAVCSLATAQQIAVLKYNGGGDWYANPTALPNLINYCNDTIGTQLNEQVETVEAGSVDIFQYPFIHMTGHGNVVFSPKEIKNLKEYLYSGGFIHIDDNYGMKPYLDETIKEVFPEKNWIELPNNHPIFNSYVSFPDGLPKIHEHDGKRPQALGVFHEGRLVLLFTYESDLSDGWENPEVHNDPPQVRKKALDMGANILKYVFTH